ncbi:hypothetical protein RF11_06677 [Thelohanellus kitauei]|uniref:Transposase Tc1-like domain-containing protein n=1 Tax=Thelohanellus kitauei TaxID=669202 RepID=A0A0C2MJC5_THEKT|nr:hypothetical protein RF11_06677 [Thelohanellus kitauei]
MFINKREGTFSFQEVETIKENGIYSQKELLCDIIDEDCTRTVQRVRDLFFKRTNITISRSTAARCLKEFHYTLKMVRVIPEWRNNTSTILLREEYAINFC